MYPSEVDETDEIIATISRKHGKTPIGRLRKTYGCNFAPLAPMTIATEEQGRRLTY